METSEDAVKKLFDEKPAWIVLGLVSLAVVLFAPAPNRPWTQDLPPVGGRYAGPWRGKGSFGSGPFGPQIGHR